MKHLAKFRPSTLLAVGFGAGLVLSGLSELLFKPLVLQANAQSNIARKVSNTDKAQLDLKTFAGDLPDQSHVMADVGYHFANLWFAADKQNWPLANYYLGETRSHLRWFLRIHPVRKTKAGAEVDLKGILDAVDNSFLSQVGKAITNQDIAAFRSAYRQTLDGCYACHQACEKPFLQPHIPTAPSTSIINFDPGANQGL
jgi:hypothetical protein